MTSKILLIRPPQTPIGSHTSEERLPSLDLLNAGAFLIKLGCEVVMLDAELNAITLFDIVRACRKHAPDYVILENPSAKPVRATSVLLCSMLKFAMPNLVIFYGAAFSTTMSPLNLVDAYLYHGETSTLSNSSSATPHHPGRYRR